MPHIRHGSLALVLSITIGAALPRTATHPAPLPTTLLVRVVDSLSRLPLPNAEVTAVSRRALTDARGEVRIGWPAEGTTLSVRVRQLGFRYVERTVRRGTSPSATEDTVVVALARAAFALPQMVATAKPRCRDIGGEAQIALSKSSLDLLRFGAEQYNAFRETYPFDITIERRTVINERGRLSPMILRQEEVFSADDWGDRYTPGQVLQRTGSSGYFVPLLFVSALADSVFLERHCFVARGVVTQDGRRVIRLDFSPALGVRDVDWEGSAWLDSAASVLARIDFRLTNLRDRSGPQEFQGYTVFSMPTPFIAMPDSTVARWSSGTSSGAYGTQPSPGAVQAVTIRSLVYRGAKPPPP